MVHGDWTINFCSTLDAAADMHDSASAFGRSVGRLLGLIGVTCFTSSAESFPAPARAMDALCSATSRETGHISIHYFTTAKQHDAPAFHYRIAPPFRIVSPWPAIYRQKSVPPGDFYR